MTHVSGVFFKALVGKEPSECDGLRDIERSVELVTGKSLQVRFYQSDLVSPRGSIFPIGLDHKDDIDKSFFNI
ncbi:MAG: hypothetical protein R8M45_12200 [Ghiorsea sp.]